MAKKSTTSTEPAVITTSTLQEGTHTPESDRANGAGNTAGPAGLPEAFIAALVESAGCADADHVVEMAKVGVSLMEVLEAASLGEGPLKGWADIDEPTSVVALLCARIVDLETKLAFSNRPAEAEGKRGFVALMNVRKDNVLHEIHSPLWLTIDEHADLVLSLAVDPVWDNGIRAEG